MAAPDEAPDSDRYDRFGSLFGRRSPAHLQPARPAVQPPEPTWPGARSRSPFGDDDEYVRRPAPGATRTTRSATRPTY